MRDRVDVAIVGGGLAGSALAAVLARRGVAVALCDLHSTCPPDFRAEKLSASQMRRLDRLGLGAPVRAVGTPIEELAIARFGRIVERRRNDEMGVDYADLVGAVRTTVPPSVLRIGRVARIDPARSGGGDTAITSGDGHRVEAKLVVVATGLSRGLVEQLGIRRVVVESEHCLAIGFDLALARAAPRRLALTYHGERLADRSAYLTVFPLGSRLRANLFVYRRRGEEWADAFRARPAATLDAMMPGLAPILGPYEVVGRPLLRPIGLHATEEPARDGIVLIGDAFATTCPTGGTGVDKVLTDVARLAALAPGWLAAGDTGAAAIAQFYADPEKRACDAHARRMIAYARAMALDPGLAWRARRWRNYLALSGRGWLRRQLVRTRPDGLVRDV